MILKATRPWEVILLFPVNIKLNVNSVIYFACDSFSELVYEIGTANENNEFNLLNSISNLMENEDFKKYTHPFTLTLKNHEN